MFPELANNPGEGESAPDPELANEADTTPETSETDEQTQPEGQAEPDDSEEIEWDGAKYKIPKAVKPGIMFHSDYTKKTQELSDQRRAFQQRSSVEAELAKDHARLIFADDAIKGYEAQLQSWQGMPEHLLTEEQRQYVAKLSADYYRVRATRDQAKAEFDAKVSNRSQELQRDAAKRIEEGEVILRRDIKDWNEQALGKLQAYAKREFGFTAEEIANSRADPRVVKALHRLATLEEKAAKAAAAAKTAQAAESAKPPAQVGATARAATIKASSTASDKLSSEEWLKRRNAELRAQR